MYCYEIISKIEQEGKKREGAEQYTLHSAFFWKVEGNDFVYMHGIILEGYTKQVMLVASKLEEHIVV